MYYTIPYINVNEHFLSDSAKVDSQNIRNIIDVPPKVMHTVAKPFAGITPGCSHVEITISNIEPSYEFESNPEKFIGSYQDIDFTIDYGDQERSFRGSITRDNFASATKSGSKLWFTASGQFIR